MQDEGWDPEDSSGSAELGGELTTRIQAELGSPDLQHPVLHEGGSNLRLGSPFHWGTLSPKKLLALQSPEFGARQMH